MNRIATIVVFLSFACVELHAQQGMLLYNMQDIPQRNYLNPALQYKGDAAIGLPLVSSLYVNVSNSAFKYSDLIRHSNDDSLYIDADNMISKLKETNYINAGFEADLFVVGFRIKSSFFSFAMTEKATLHFSYPKQLMEFAWKGNGAFIDETVDINFGMNFTHRRDYSLTYCYQFKDKFSAGFRFKSIYGMENISIKSAQAGLYTNPTSFALTAQSNININTSGIESNTFDEFNVTQYMFDRQNTGWGIDIGTQIRFTDQISFTASIIDYGKIKWNSLTDNYTSRETNTEFTYYGIDLNQFFEDTSGADQVFQNVMDTLEAGFNIRHTNHSYETKLPLQFYTGANYTINQNHVAGILVHGIKFEDKTHIDFTLSYHIKAGKWLSLSSGWSYINNSYSNLGAGIAMHLGSFQLYFVSDNIFGAIFPTRTQNANARAGLNFVVGRNK